MLYIMNYILFIIQYITCYILSITHHIIYHILYIMVLGDTAVLIRLKNNAYLSTKNLLCLVHLAT